MCSATLECLFAQVRELWEGASSEAGSHASCVRVRQTNRKRTNQQNLPSQTLRFVTLGESGIVVVAAVHGVCLSGPRVGGLRIAVGFASRCSGGRRFASQAVTT